MKLGNYRLERTVENPKPGRRRSDWTHWKQWEVGMRFILKDEVLVMPEGYDDCIVMKLTRPDSITLLSLEDPRSKALLPHLVEVEEKPSEWLHRMDRGTNMAPAVIDHLVASGKVTRADIEEARELCIDALLEKEGE